MYAIYMILKFWTALSGTYLMLLHSVLLFNITTYLLHTYCNCQTLLAYCHIWKWVKSCTRIFKYIRGFQLLQDEKSYPTWCYTMPGSYVTCQPPIFWNPLPGRVAVLQKKSVIVNKEKRNNFLCVLRKCPGTIEALAQYIMA